MKSAIQSLQRPGFLYGAVAALILSFAAAVLFAAVSTVLGASTALRLTLSLATFAYTVWLLAVSGIRVCRVVTLSALAVLMLGTILWSPSLAMYALIHAGLIWLVRCCYYHNGLLVSAADLGLCVLSLAAAVWAVRQSHSIFLSLWCFLLVQAVILPLLQPDARLQSGSAVHQERFRRASRSAEAALRRLV
jgi:hypothetical protein